MSYLNFICIPKKTTLYLVCQIMILLLLLTIFEHSILKKAIIPALLEWTNFNAGNVSLKKNLAKNESKIIALQRSQPLMINEKIQTKLIKKQWVSLSKKSHTMLQQIKPTKTPQFFYITIKGDYFSFLTLFYQVKNHWPSSRWENFNIVPWDYGNAKRNLLICYGIWHV